MKRNARLNGGIFCAIWLSAGSAPAAPVAWYRMEDTTVTTGLNTIFDVMADSSGNGYHLDFWPGGAGGWGQITAATHSTDVPTRFTFHTGFGGGTYSWDNATLSSSLSGCLFFETGGTVFPFRFPSADFTVEGFFKTAGDQSAAGRMDLTFQSQAKYQWLINLNEGEAGKLAFGIAAAPYYNVALSPNGGTGKNFADGKWHYFAARYDDAANGTKDRLTLQVVDEDGNVYGGTTETADGFSNYADNNNLLLGRYNNIAGAKGHLVGKMDEIRVSTTALAAADLMVEIPAHSISGIGFWRMEETLPLLDGLRADVVTDSSTPVDQKLDWYSGVGSGHYAYTTSAVPPALMLAVGRTGGSRSFDAGRSLAGSRGGQGEVLFLNGSDTGTPAFSATSFTVEAFFKTAGAGLQEIVCYGFNGRFAVYLDNGQLKFKAGGQVLTTGAVGKFNDDQWHYVAVSYETRAGDDELKLRAFSSGDSAYTVVTGTTAGALAAPGRNLSIGGDNVSPGGQGFRGLIDEVRFSSYVRLNSELLGVPRAQGTVFIVR